VYDYYKKWVISKEFSLSPDDSYDYVLNEAAEDIDDDALFLLNKLGLKAPSKDAMLQWASHIRALRRTSPHTVTLSVDSGQWAQPIKTLREMVLWLDWVRQHQ
jgi:adenylosuccinate lyase